MVVFINELGQVHELLLNKEQTEIQMKRYQELLEYIKTVKHPRQPDLIKWCSWRIATEEDLEKAKEKGYKELL